MGYATFSLKILLKQNFWSHYIEILHEQMVGYMLLEKTNVDFSMWILKAQWRFCWWQSLLKTGYLLALLVSYRFVKIRYLRWPAQHFCAMCMMQLNPWLDHLSHLYLTWFTRLKIWLPLVCIIETFGKPQSKQSKQNNKKQQKEEQTRRFTGRV